MNAVVTGGCHGLGKYFTEYLLTKGYKVTAIYNTSIKEANELEKKYENVTVIKCDIRNEDMVRKTLSNIDNIDILINNASISLDDEYFNKSGEDFLNVLNTNVVGNFLVTKYAIPKMNNNSIIINISSNNSLNAYNPISMDYDASKAGINMLTKDFSLILNNVKIVSVCPGWINTESVKDANPKYIEEELKRVKQNKLIEPEYLVKCIIDNIDTYENGEIIEMSEL